MATNENATYIWELDQVYPDGATDFVYNGDDEIRQLKLTIKNSFPNITGIITSNHTELNYLDGQSAPGDMFSANFSQVVRADATSVPTVTATYNIGSNAARFATIYATNIDVTTDVTATTFTGQASSALYADLAELYAADQEYAAGTVVMFGGEFEVTKADKHTHKVAGVVSTNPAYLMNAGLEPQYKTDSFGFISETSTPVAIALTGRVPVKVQGKIEKGDLLIAGRNGFAIACPSAAYNQMTGCFIGKAIEDFNLDGSETPGGLPKDGVIEVAIGVK